MYFCTGPPRTYAASLSTAPPLQRERFEDVAIAMHPHLRVFARVTSRSVALWSANVHLAHPQYRKRHLTSVPRTGSHVDAAQLAQSAVSASDSDASGFTDSSSSSNADDLRQIFAVWTIDNKLAVVERGSQCVEFYAFPGLADVEAAVLAGGLDTPAPGASTGARAASPSTGSLGATLQGAFVDEYPLNQGNTPRDVDDTASALTAVPGTKYLFVGMASGLICVVDVAPEDDASGWFGEPQRTKMWKIDVLPHLHASRADDDNDDDDLEPPTCYALACGTRETVTDGVSTLYLVACFDGGKCFIMLLTPATKRIDQLLSLVNTERDAAAAAADAAASRCTSIALSPNGARLALGWSDGGISLFRLAMRTTVAPVAVGSAPDAAAPAAPTTALTLEPIRELSLAPWGYTTDDVGSVTAIAWSLDARTIAVGYALRGFSLFSLDGCRLMSSLPQHQQPRPETPAAGPDAALMASKEACADGVLALAWTRESASLLVVPRGEAFTQLVSPPASPRSRQPSTDDRDATNTVESIALDDVVSVVSVELLKQDDGLCLSLAGAPGRCGAWVRSENSFTRRARDGGVGPAEASGQIRAGDLLVGIHDRLDMLNAPFEAVIAAIKRLPAHARVTLTFIRVDFDRFVPLAVQALTSAPFLTAQGMDLLDDEDLSVREYALRMQVLHGDCDVDARPPLLAFEQRAKFDGWDAMRGTAHAAAQHRYVKLLLALARVWDPLTTLDAVVAHANAVLAQQPPGMRSPPASPRGGTRDRHTVASMRRPSALSLVEFDFAQSVRLSGGAASHLVLLERARVRVVASPSLDDPCALTSCATYAVPAEYETKCAPLRLVAVSPSGQQIAVAGQRGFCLLNLVTGKWRMFGNVNDEQDLLVHALLWVHDDVVVVTFTRVLEDHKLMHVQAYPRNHLDEDSILARAAFATTHSEDVVGDATTSAAGARTGKTVQYSGDCLYALELSTDASHVFCLSMRELWSFGLDVTGSVKQRDLAVRLDLRRRVKLPQRVAETHALQLRSHASRRVQDVTVIPRFTHIQDAKVRAAHVVQDAPAESSSSGWFSGLFSLIAGGEVPEQYAPDDVLPRFAFLDDSGDVVVWDPERRSQRVLCSNISTMTRLFVSSDVAPHWPAPCRLMYGLYGPDGMRLWLPLLDGVYTTHTLAFDHDAFALETFVACHDPLRAKTFELEFGSAPATAELYDHVVSEYGIALEQFRPSSPRSAGSRPDGVRNLRGCLTSVDDASAKDRMLRFDSDVQVLGVQQAFGLLVGISQDVYVPSGVFLPSYDVFTRVQPFFHTLLCYLVTNHQVTWATHVLTAIRQHYALSTPTQELFLHAMLEACFSGECSAETFAAALKLLQPARAVVQRQLSLATGTTESIGIDTTGNKTGMVTDSTAGDLDEYCEIVAHVARKSEPSRLKILFPAAGDALELLAICRARSELRTAANFLLVLEESSPSAPPAVRKAVAADLLTQCIEHDEWNLAQHVVRVARDWEHRPDETDGSSDVAVSSIDTHLAQFVWTDFVHGEYERVVASVEELQAKLPPTRAREIAIENEQEEAIVAQRLHDVFVATNKLRQLRCVS